MPRYTEPTVVLTLEEWDDIQLRLEQAERDHEFVEWYWREMWPPVDHAALMTNTLLELVKEGRLT